MANGVGFGGSPLFALLGEVAKGQRLKRQDQEARTAAAFEKWLAKQAADRAEAAEGRAQAREGRESQAFEDKRAADALERYRRFEEDRRKREESEALVSERKARAGYYQRRPGGGTARKEYADVLGPGKREAEKADVSRRKAAASETAVKLTELAGGDPEAALAALEQEMAERFPDGVPINAQEAEEYLDMLFLWSALVAPGDDIELLE